MGREGVGYRDEVGSCPGFRLGGALFLLRGILPVDRLGVGSVMDVVVCLVRCGWGWAIWQMGDRAVDAGITLGRGFGGVFCPSFVSRCLVFRWWQNFEQASGDTSLISRI